MDADQIRIGDWVLEVRRNRLHRDGESIALEPLATEVLAHFAAHPGKVVSTDELVEEVWARKFVGDAPVYRVVAELRRALQDDARRPQYIETIRKRGYRLVADVEVLAGDGGVAPQQIGQAQAPAADAPSDTIIEQPLSRAPARSAMRRGLIILIGFAIAVGFLLINRFAINSGPEDGQSATNIGSTASIAILPFSNLSDDPDTEYFGDGLAEELLNLLATVDGLRVAARTSSFHFKGKNPTIGEVAGLLDVATVLEGSVRRSDDTIRVIVKLVDADSGEQLWSARYERPLADLFAVQDDIANQIIDALAPRIGGAQKPKIESDTGKITPDQFERFLLARRHFHEGTDDSIETARDQFLALTKVAPGYAPAWAWLARSWLAMRIGVSTETARQSARDAVDTALLLDPQEAMAYIAEGRLNARNANISAALESYDRALELDPNLVDAYLERQSALVELGKPDLAIASLYKARSIDPLHPRVLTDLAHLLNLQGNPEEALHNIDKLALVNPVAAISAEIHLLEDNYEIGRALYLYEQTGRGGSIEFAFFSLAVDLHHEIAERGDSPLLPVALARVGRREQALEALGVVKDRIGNGHLRADIEFQTHIILGNFELAHEQLWQRWSSQGSESAQAEMSILDRIALGALVVKLGRIDQSASVMDALRQDAVAASELHTAVFHLQRGLIAGVEGDLDEAYEHLSAAADNGFLGFWLYGTPTPHPWLFDTDPRFERVFARFTQSRDRQVAILNRLRQTKPTPEEVRQEFLAELAKR